MKISLFTRVQLPRYTCYTQDTFHTIETVSKFSSTKIRGLETGFARSVTTENLENCAHRSNAVRCVAGGNIREDHESRGLNRKKCVRLPHKNMGCRSRVNTFRKYKRNLPKKYFGNPAKDSLHNRSDYSF